MIVAKRCFWQKHNIFCHGIIHNLLRINTYGVKLVVYRQFTFEKKYCLDAAG